MSSPTERSEGTRTQDATHASSRQGADIAMEDTASSVAPRVPSPSVPRTRSPNTSFKGMRAARARSASPRPRRPASPLGISVAQRRAQFAAQSAATAVSGVGRVEAETRRVRALVDATSAEAKSVRSDVEARLATIASAAETGTARVASEIGERVRQVAEYAEAQSSRTATELSQRLETEINAAATSAAATAEINTRTMVEGARRDLQAQFDTNRAETLQRYEETKQSVRNITAQIQNLSDQLKQFNPASVSGVEVFTGQIETRVQQQLVEQDKKIQTLTDAVLESKKESQSNADTLQSLIVGIENLGDNMKQMQETMLQWQEDINEQEQGQKNMEEELLQEVPVPQYAIPPQSSVPLAVSMFQVQSPVTPPLPTIPEDQMVQAQGLQNTTQMKMDQDIQTRWERLTTLQTSVNPAVPVQGINQDTQAKIPEFFDKIGSVSNPIVSSRPIITTPAPAPEEMLHRFKARDAQLQCEAEIALPKAAGTGGERENRPAPETTTTRGMPEPRRITPEKVGSFGNVAGLRGGVGPQETIDLATASSFPSRGSIFGTTTIAESEAQRIKDEVYGVMREQFAAGRAALRAELGLPAEEVKLDKTAPEMRTVETGSRSAESEGNSVPRSSFGSPVSVTNPTPSTTTVMHAQPSFATAAWKPKEPPCFFGRSAEDAHTWVSLVRNYLTFMSGSDAQQVAYTVTLFRDAAHEWYCSFERRNRGPPRDWASLVAALLDRFGSNIRSQEAQSQLMSISQGQRSVRDYASQFETLLGRLESYDEGQLLNQFIWGLQPDLARSVSLHYPRTIAKAVSLAETTELAAKASRRPGWKSGTAGNPTKGPNTSNKGRGQWKNNRGGGRGGYRGGRSSMGSARGNSRGRGGRGSQGSVNYDPLACYRCGVRGHLARDCPQSAPSQGSVNQGPPKGTFSKSGHKGPRGRGRGRQVRFGGFNVLYDEDGNSYPMDAAGQLYVPLEFDQTADEHVVTEEEKLKEIKN